MTLSLVLLTLVLLLIYLPAFALLFAYTLNLYFMIVVTIWRRRRAISAPPLTEIPLVTVQLPLYNERYVSRRIIDAAARLDWPRDRLEIQVLDDSTDDTKAIVAESVAEWQARGLNIRQVLRPTREGYKAGALAYALKQAQGELIAIFDADFIPAPSFLKDTVPALLANPKTAFVQARWDHLNLRDSWLTRIQAVAIDGHFVIEQFARYYSGFAFNFNGTAGVWRRKAIDEAGGWQSDTLTEDLDLSYRAWLSGWHGLYLHNIQSPAELPPTMSAFRRQQARWQRGSIECARLLLPSIWRSEHRLLAKLQATIHLLGPLVTPIMALLMLSYPFLLLLFSHFPEAILPLGVINLIGPLTIAPTVFFVVAQVLARPLEWRSFVAVALCQVIGAGLSMNTLRAIIRAIIGQRGEFLRTPKWGDTSLRASAYHLRADVGVLIDVLWGLYCLVLLITGLVYGHMFITVYGAMSCLGSWWVALWTLWPDLRMSFRQQRAAWQMD